MTGKIEVICGPMGSGKSSELIRLITRFDIAGKITYSFKPIIDTRDGSQISSRTGNTYDNNVFLVKDTKEIQKHLVRIDGKLDVIAIDEAQFFDTEIIDCIDNLSKLGIHCIIAGLDKDFKGEPFGSMPQLLAIADNVMKLTAICMKCKCEDATMSYRKNSLSDQIIVGGNEIYEPRCRSCWYKGQ